MAVPRPPPKQRFDDEAKTLPRATGSRERLYFQPNHLNIYRMPADGGPVQQVTQFEESGLFREEPTISPDRCGTLLSALGEQRAPSDPRRERCANSARVPRSPR